MVSLKLRPLYSQTEGPSASTYAGAFCLGGLAGPRVSLDFWRSKIYPLVGWSDMYCHFEACSQNCKKGLLASSCLSVIISWSVLLRIRNASGKSSRKNQNTHFMFSNLFWKLCHLWDNVENNGRVGQATNNNMAHAHYMLDT